MGQDPIDDGPSMTCRDVYACYSTFTTDRDTWHTQHTTHVAHTATTATTADVCYCVDVRSGLVEHPHVYQAGEFHDALTYVRRRSANPWERHG